MNEFGMAQCAGKERFTSFNRAKNVAKRVSARHDAPYDPYPCHYCGGFHIGRSDRRRQRSRKVRDRFREEFVAE